MAWRAGQGEVSPFFILVSGLGVVLLLLSGPVEMDSQVIRYSTPVGRYQIKWDEVQNIETDMQGGNLVFNGADKRVAVPGPGYWSGADKENMVKLLFAQMEQRQIQMATTQKAVSKWSKNAKI
jgi:hypothetical protein